MYRLCIVFLFLFVLKLVIIPANACTSFDNTIFTIKDTDGESFNRTISGCAERKTLDGINAKELYIRNQVVPTLAQDSVRHIINLRTLSFWGNKMYRVVPGAFRNLPALKNIQLSYGNIREVPRGVFETIPTIELIRIHNNEIDFIGGNAFANLVFLKKIFASNNKLEYWNREWFTNSTNLEIMDFQNNFIRTIPRRAFASLVKLKQIYFDSNEISTIQANAFEGITQLEYLGLRNNRLTEIKEEIFPNNLNILSFLIDANYLNFLSNEVLNKVSVRDITIDNNPWKCPCLDRITFWLYSTNGTMRRSSACTGDNVPVCAYSTSFSQSCLEVVDEELTKRYINSLKKLKPPLLEHCAKLD